MRKMGIGVAALAAGSLLLAGCASGGGTTTPAPAESEAPIDASGVTLTVWTDENRQPAIEAAAATFEEETGATVELVQKNFEDIRNDFTNQVPTGEGPDITIGAHDWLGSLVQAGVVATVDLGESAANFEKVATDAFTYDGQTYALPYSLETIALIQNTDLVEHVEDRVPAGCEVLVTGVDHVLGCRWEHREVLPDRRSREPGDDLHPELRGHPGRVLHPLGGAPADAFGVAVAPDAVGEDVAVPLIDRVVAHRLPTEVVGDGVHPQSVAFQDLPPAADVGVVVPAGHVEVVAPAGDLEPVVAPLAREARDLVERQVGPLAGEQGDRSRHRGSFLGCGGPAVSRSSAPSGSGPRSCVPPRRGRAARADRRRTTDAVRCPRRQPS